MNVTPARLDVVVRPRRRRLVLVLLPVVHLCLGAGCLRLLAGGPAGPWDGAGIGALLFVLFVATAAFAAAAVSLVRLAAFRMSRGVGVGPRVVALSLPQRPGRPVVVDRARLLIMLRSRPSHEVVLELLESEPGRIDYRLDGFDIPAVRRTVDGYALRCHDPVP